LRLFGAHLELVDTPLLLHDVGVGNLGGFVPARLAATIAAMAVAAAAALLVALALRPSRLSLRRELMNLRRLASRKRRLRRLGWRLLRPTLPLLGAALLLRAAIRTRSAIGTPVASRSLMPLLPVAARRAIAPAFEATLLLPIPGLLAIAAAPVTSIAAVATALAPLLIGTVVAARLVIAARLALRLRRGLRLRRRGWSR
jgi:hypothetical protein